jgi:phosphoenolpyruvate carboxylase
MDEIASDSRAAYRSLVCDEPRFVEYFRQATPIDVIERMPIGSRPSARRSGDRLDQLRAIPWVFAWTQSRHLLPGWFGLGTALERGVKRHGEAALAEMLQGWPFLRALMDDVETVLAETDLSIAARYAGLAGSLGDVIFPIVRAEYDRATALTLRLKGSASLLDDDPVLQRAIRLRNPYVDPMSLIQIDLLRRWRSGGRREGKLERALFSSVKGIARGLQNTG